MGDDQHQPQLTYDLGLLEQSEAKWKRSAALRIVYGSIFEAIKAHMVDGPSLELGSGIGNIKERIPHVMTSDLVKTPYVDTACSAYDIPPPLADSGAACWGNILGMDVLHHLCRPMEFFQSAAATLQPGGKIILAEPAATPFGRIFYTLFHSEPIAPAKIVPPFVMPPDNESGEFANMGMAVSLFKHHRQSVLHQLDALGLELLNLEFRDILAYPLSGGYSGPQLAPAFAIRWLLALEGALPQWLLSCLGLRVLVVLRKR